MDLLNIGLMLVSGLAAWLWPLQAFLFVYAVLGPLHYFTEISWLHDREYFVVNRSWWMALPCIPLTAMCIWVQDNTLLTLLTWAAVAVAVGAITKRLWVGVIVFALGCGLSRPPAPAP